MVQDMPWMPSRDAGKGTDDKAVCVTARDELAQTETETLKQGQK